MVLSAGPHLPWRVLGAFAAAVLVIAIAACGTYIWMSCRGRLPAVFTPRRVQLVHFELVHRPVRVCEAHLLTMQKTPIHVLLTHAF
jgi:hypothetical protein